MTDIRSYFSSYFSESVIQSPLFSQLLDMQRQMGFEAALSFDISKKVANGREYIDRLNFFYTEKLVDRYWACIKILEKMKNTNGISPETAQSLAVVMDEGPNNLTQIVIGLDFRPERNQSRIKIWFEFTDAAYLTKQIFKKLGYYQKVKRYIIRDDILLGFGFFPDGRSEVKPHLNYGEFRHDLRAKLILSSFFEEPVFTAFDFGYPLYLCFRGNEPRIFIYFCHTDVEDLLRCMQLEIPHNALLLKGQKPDIFGAYYDDLLKRTLHEYNLYYQFKIPMKTKGGIFEPNPQQA